MNKHKQYKQKTKLTKKQNKKQNKKNKKTLKSSKKIKKTVHKHHKKFLQLQPHKTSSKKISKEDYKYIINELYNKGYDRKFITFGEILSLIPYPEYNIAIIDKIYEYLINNNIHIIKNTKLLDTSEEISQEQLLKDTDPEE